MPQRKITAQVELNDGVATASLALDELRQRTQTVPLHPRYPEGAPEEFMALDALRTAVATFEKEAYEPLYDLQQTRETAQRNKELGLHQELEAPTVPSAAQTRPSTGRATLTRAYGARRTTTQASSPRLRPAMSAANATSLAPLIEQVGPRGRLVITTEGPTASSPSASPEPWTSPAPRAHRTSGCASTSPTLFPIIYRRIWKLWRTSTAQQTRSATRRTCLVLRPV